MSNLVGQQVSHYQIKAFLGSGRIGSVYQAIDLNDFSVVALKIIKLEFAKRNKVRRQFLEEIRSRPRLEHPGIIQIYKAGIDTQLDLLYMTMEFMSGRSLTAYLQQLQFNKQQISMEAALILVADVAEALQYAHQEGIIHQDVRPNVILFRANDKSDESSLLPGRAAIGDFSLTTILEHEDELFADSLPYSAPELFLNQGSDGRSDIYSLGSILYQLLTGRTPFSPTTTAEATRQHPYQTPSSPRSLRPDIPLPIETAVLQAIAKKPEDRFQTGAEMAQALRQLAETVSTKSSTHGEQLVASIVKTQPELPDILAIHSAWSTNEDRVTVTRNVPHSLNRQLITVGRSESNDIVLPETSITRLHAQLERTQTGWQIRDLGSQNGTFLDGKALLPDIPEPWDSHQTLRIGPYFLHLQLGKGYDYQRITFSASVMSDKVKIHAGQRKDLLVTIRNNGDAVDDFVVKMDRFPADWVTLPAPVQLSPADPPEVVSVSIHPPKIEDLPLGRHKYLLTVCSQTNERDRVSIPGVVIVLPVEEHFSTHLSPLAIVGKGQAQLLVGNGGLTEKSFNITASNPDNKLRLGLWQPKELPQALPSTGSETKNGGTRQRPSTSISSMSSRFPFIRRLTSAPSPSFTVKTKPRQALNRILPGLGSFVPKLKLPTSISKKSGKKGKPVAKKEHPRAFLDNYQELTFPDALFTQVKIPAGQEETVYLSIAPRKRPFWGRKDHRLPFEIAVSNGSGNQQTITGQLDVKPRIRSKAWSALLLIFLTLFLCSLITYQLWQNPTVPAILTSPLDRDNDSLNNLAEVFVHQTNPNNPDTDGDTLTDAAEIAAGSNPDQADTDNDGLDDAREQRIGTDPQQADTDKDSFSDGWEVLHLGTDPLVANSKSTIDLFNSTPTPTLAPTATNTPIPTSTPDPTNGSPEIATMIPDLVLTSLSQADGHISFAEGNEQYVLENSNEILQVGEGDENDQQFKGFLSFDTADIPAGAIIETATLRLYQIDTTGNLSNLGGLHVDIAQISGFNDNNALEDEDFSAPAAIINTVTLTLASTNENWVTGILNEPGKQALNRQGITQFRLYFTLPNNNDDFEDWVHFYGADIGSDLRPQLIITFKPPG